MKNAPIQWFDLNIDELTAIQLHDYLRLRVDVFIVEQNCVYPELDGQDALVDTRHVFAIDGSSKAIAAARVLAATDSLPVRIGRVVVDPDHRGTGLSKELMDRVMQICTRLYPDQIIELSAQVGVDGFYAGYGFKVVSEDYLEDGIPHRDMRLTP